MIKASIRNVHNELGYAHHVYMATLIEDLATDIGLFISEEYSYPEPNINPETLFHYEAVSWSGIAYISDPVNSGMQIINPVFLAIYPNIIDQQKIIDIFTAENTGTLSGAISPLLNNNCN